MCLKLKKKKNKEQTGQSKTKREITIYPIGNRAQKKYVPTNQK